MKKLLSWLLLIAMVLSFTATASLADDKGATFTMLVDDGGKVEDKIMLPILEEQTGVKVDFMLYPWDAANERKNIMLANGDYPDAIGGWLLSENDILSMGMTDGTFVPIESYITEKDTPNIWAALSLPGVRQAFTLPDGHIYTIPYVIPTPKVAFNPYINGDWLKAVGMEMPKTVEEFADVLRAFKTKDPNGNGKADEIPFSADPHNKDLGMLAGWFGVDASGTNGTHYVQLVNGKLQFNANQEGYKEFIKFFAGLYAEGLIDPELFTQDNATWKAKGAKESNLYGCSVAYGSGDFYQMEPGTNATPFLPLPVLSSAYCDKPVYHRGGYGSTMFRSQVAITNKAKDPGVIVRWFDNVFAPDNSLQIQWGPYDIRLVKVSDTEYHAADETKLSEADRKKYDWGNYFCQSLPKFMRPEFGDLLPTIGKPAPYNESKARDAIYEENLTELPPMVWMTTEAAEKLATLGTDIDNYVSQKMAEWISGQKDVNAEWDSYCAELKKLGVDELVSTMQAAIDGAAK